MKPIGPALALALSLWGCGDSSFVRRETSYGTDDLVELREAPFFAQRTYQCGPAALATLLVYAGRKTSPAELVEKVYLPGRKGSLQVELVGAVRREGLVPYRIEPTLDAIVEELRAGRPVLVLQNLGLAAFPVWHYAVAIGYDLKAGKIILRSGTTHRKIMPVDRFVRTWKGAAFWGFVVVAPGVLPVHPTRSRYLKEIAALEAVGQYEAALLAYRAALEKWPRDTTARLGVGNSLYGLGDFSAATDAYRVLIEEDPHNPLGYNNLAQVLADQGRYDRALAVISKGRSLSAASPDLRRIMERTEEEILGKR